MYLKRLKELREDNDKTQKEIAQILKMKQPQYARYEKGIRDLPLELAKELAIYYSTSIDYICELTDNPKCYVRR